MQESADPFSAGDVVTLVNEGNTRYLDGDGPGQDWNVGTSLNGQLDDQWELLDNGDGSWSLRNQQHRRYLDADGSNADWNVGQSFKIADDDRWEIIEDDGAYILRSVRFDRYLHQDADLNVVTEADASSDFSRWQIQLVAG